MNDASSASAFTFADLFAGIGGCRLAFERAGGECVFTSEWNAFARKTYEANFGHREREDHIFVGDIRDVDEPDIPEHDVLVAGFPCQPFSIAGVSKKNSLGRAHGFQDETQGTLFFDVERIIGKRRPKAFVLENVRNLESHDGGNTFRVIRERLEARLGYEFHARVLDASIAVPQRRKRIFIVGFDSDIFSGGSGFDFENVLIPGPPVRPTMAAVLHESGPPLVERPYTDRQGRPASKYTISADLWSYLRAYKEKHRKAGNGFGYGLVTASDTARTLSARYYKDGSEVLVSRGPRSRPRKLTPRECARLMGFGDDFVIPVSDTQAYRQFGNSVVVPVAAAVAREVSAALLRNHG